MSKEIKFEGVCVRCGLCCEIAGYRCLNLITPAPVGVIPAILPGPTTCRVYDKRYDGMPIVLMDSEGNIARATCGKNSTLESLAIVERGIGKGCSLKVIEETACG